MIPVGPFPVEPAYIYWERPSCKHFPLHPSTDKEFQCSHGRFSKLISGSYGDPSNQNLGFSWIFQMKGGSRSICNLFCQLLWCEFTRGLQDFCFRATLEMTYNHFSYVDLGLSEKGAPLNPNHHSQCKHSVSTTFDQPQLNSPTGHPRPSWIAIAPCPVEHGRRSTAGRNWVEAAILFRYWSGLGWSVHRKSCFFSLNRRGSTINFPLIQFWRMWLCVKTGSRKLDG